MLISVNYKGYSTCKAITSQILLQLSLSTLLKSQFIDFLCLTNIKFPDINTGEPPISKTLHYI